MRTEMIELRPVELITRQSVAEATMAFWFSTRGQDFPFQAGQHTAIRLIKPAETDAQGNRRTFSIASSPLLTDRFIVAMRMRSTAFKRNLERLPIRRGEDSLVVAELPHGHLTLPATTDRPVILIAGGIGITPFRSMIEWATTQAKPYRLTLVYSNRTPAQTAFLAELEGWTKTNPRFRLIATATDSDDPAWPHDRGRIDVTFLNRHLGPLPGPLYYLAGPPRMVVAMRTLLLGAGVPPADIKLETFTGY